MQTRQVHAVNGWIRENYGDDFLEDIVDIIFAYYRIIIESQILTETEKEDLMNLLVEKMPKSNIKSIETKLLFRASEHDYDLKQFQQDCSDKGPTFTIIHNDSDHIFGGYVTIPWKKYEMADKYRQPDPTAFLFTLRPKLRYIPFKNKSINTMAIWMDRQYGPVFGNGADIAIRDKCNSNKHSFVTPKAFDFTRTEITGSEYQYFTVKEYEVFSIVAE